MAKRKAGRGTGRKTGGGARGAARRTGAAKKAARKKTARASKSAAARKSRSRASSAGGGRVRKASKAPKRSAMKATARKPAARTTPKKAARKATVRAKSRPRPAARQAAPKVPLRKAAAPGRRAESAVVRKTPALDRVRRTIADEDDIVPTPPSSLDLDRTASAVRTGRREMRERFDQHTETSPALTGGDVDADWESAYSVGDEAPGGDNPTPDQDIVDDIGRAVGLQYEDNEELKSEQKIADRDAHRWELDPASAEDYNEHDQD